MNYCICISLDQNFYHYFVYRFHYQTCQNLNIMGVDEHGMKCHIHMAQKNGYQILFMFWDGKKYESLYMVLAIFINNSRAASLIGCIFISEPMRFNVFNNFVTSNSLFDRPAFKILDWSSIVKFSHVNVGSTYSLYISNISLCEIVPGFVKLYIPVSLLFANKIAAGHNSSRTDIEFGIFTTFLYFLIFVIKLRGCASGVNGIRMRNHNVFVNNGAARSSTIRFVLL